MIAETLTNTYVQPDFDSLSEPIEKVVTYIEKSLPGFSNFFSGKKNKEKFLNQKLVRLLNAPDAPYYFSKDDTKEIGNREEDIGVYTNERSTGLSSADLLTQTPFFVLEAKRLPTPSGRDSREYVIGQNEDGGIERFKLEHHGKGHRHCGMIGYVEENDFSHWRKTINKWISDLSEASSDSTITWSKSEHLKGAVKKGITQRFSSTHTRLKNESFSMTHIWIKL